MCQVTHYRDFHCSHRWATIARPCYPGMGFDTCPQFVDGQVRPLPPRLVAQGEPCPRWYVSSFSLSVSFSFSLLFFFLSFFSFSLWFFFVLFLLVLPLFILLRLVDILAVLSFSFLFCALSWEVDVDG
jgi:hypothetical protein